MKVWKYGRLEVISLRILQTAIISTQRTISLNNYFQTSSLPDLHCEVLCASQRNVGKDGFEPPNSGENRFTVCCRWPLDYLPDGNHCLRPLGFLARMSRLEPEKGVEPATC
jgi:hypothetical protein